MIKLIFLTLCFGVLVLSMPYNDNKYTQAEPTQLHDKEQFFLPNPSLPKPMFPKPVLPKFKIEDFLSLIPKVKALFKPEEPIPTYENILPPITAPYRPQRADNHEEGAYEVHEPIV